MHDQLKIYVEQLKTGYKEKINLQVSSNFLDLHEDELAVAPSISIQGEAYTTGDNLILCLSCKTEVQLPCSICNTMTRVSLEAKEIAHSQELSELPSSIFDYSGVVREELLLMIPHFIECQKGNCPQRLEIQPFIKAEKPASAPDVHFPFKNL